jgi:hypothetical protein
MEVVDRNSKETTPSQRQRRQGGWWKGKVSIADNFDELPDDLAEAFGMRDP